MNLDSLFSPKSLAIIGASTDKGSVGNNLTENVLKGGFQGKVYPVNPKTEVLFDLPCYPSIMSLPEVPDLAIIIVPAKIVPTVLEESGSKGVKAAIIISSGFKEAGHEGEQLERSVKSIAEKYDIAVLGPNCLGFLHPSLRLNASFASTMPKDGNIALFSQSGALCTALLDLTSGHVGFSHFISMGNKAIIDEHHLLTYFAQEKKVNVIGCYSEGITEASTLIQTGRGLIGRATPKPVVVLKSGTTSEGTLASSSHTGALAGNDAAYEALFRQARMVRAKSLEGFLHILGTLSQNPLPTGPRIAIITNAGGLGVLATDAAIKNGLTLAHLAKETEEKLRSAFPSAASVKNPIDVLGDARADRYRLALEHVAKDSQVDMIMVIVTPQTMTEAKETAEALVDTFAATKKPVVAVFAGKDLLESGFQVLTKHNIATVTSPEDGAEALGALAQITKWQKSLVHTPFSFSDIEQATVKKQLTDTTETLLAGRTAEAILKAYGFPVLESQIVHSAEEAKSVVENFDGPAVFKIHSPDIIHKSDVGGVRLNIRRESAETEYSALLEKVKARAPEASIEGILVAPMAPTGGLELILGIKKEPGLGSLVVVGMGGIFVETYKDVAMRFAPLTREDAEEMLAELKSAPLLSGARGQAGIDREALLEMIGRLSTLATDFPEITELDINPLLAFPEKEKMVILDARLKITKT